MIFICFSKSLRSLSYYVKKSQLLLTFFDSFLYTIMDIGIRIFIHLYDFLSYADFFCLDKVWIPSITSTTARTIRITARIACA